MPPIYAQTVAATGIDPDAAPTLPEVPHWVDHNDRAELVDDTGTDTGLLPVVQP